MIKTAPVSDLRSYGLVLSKVKPGSPVYLTRNGESEYSIRSMEDEEKIQKAEAMLKLLCELNASVQNLTEEDWISAEDFRNHFKRGDEG